jgi:PAS domain S-box-containing protein
MSQASTTPPKVNILAVDDTPANLHLLTRMLSDQGYKVRITPNGKLALKAVKANPPDLILLDILMPDMDGYEVCKQLKIDERTKDIPVIFISALRESFDQVKAFSLGGVDYITKPFQAQEVLARVENQLRCQRLQKQLTEQNARLQEEIAEHKQTQEKLKESEKRYRQLFEGSVDGIVMVDIEGRIIDCNASYQKMLGYSLEELKQKTFHDITPVKLHSWEAQIVDKQVIERGYSDTYEKEYIRKDGKVFPVELTVYCHRNEAGQAEIIWAIARDISDRKQAEIERSKLIASLQKSEANLTAAQRIAHIGNWEFDVLSGKHSWSEEHFRILGLDPTKPEPTYAKLIEQIHRDDRASFQQTVSRALADGTPYELDFRIVRPDNQVRYVELRGEAVLNDSGQVIQLFGTGLDITERKLAEAALTESERKYRNLVETSQNIIWSTDTESRLTFVNQAVKQILGYEPEEMLGRPFADFTPPEQLAKDLKVFQRLLNREAIRECETIRLAKDNRPIHLLINALTLLDEQGQVVGTIGTASDITTRKLAEAEIIRSKDLLESIFNESTDAIFLVNSETGLTLDCNRIAVELFEATSKDELLNLEGHTLQKEAYTPEEINSIFDEVERYGFWSRELEYVTKSGKLFWGHLAAKPIHVAGQKINLIRITDITDRKRAEEALQQSETREREKAQALELALDELKRTQAQLIQTEKMSSLGQMIAGVAHEINNPVSFIYGNLNPARQYCQDLTRLIEIYQQTYPNPTPEIQQIVEEIDLDFLMEDWQQLMDSIQVGAERIQGIVRSLQTFSRQNESKKKPVDIHEGIDNTLLILQPRLRGVGARPEIKVIKHYGQLPKVSCYSSQLNQVFMNLLSNAIDALETQPSPRVITICTEMGSGEWGVGNGEESSPTPYSLLPTLSVVIRIADNGSGMSEELQKKIFDPFFTTKPVGRGTGLGLSISYQIVVEKHGGQLSCVSALGQGTEFTVKIPLKVN